MWYELKIANVESPFVEPISEQLEQLGALSVTLVDQNDNPILEPAPDCTPLWPQVLMSALFQCESTALLAQKNIKESFCALKLSSSIEVLADKVWERECMDQFQPQLFGSSLWICPSWCNPVDDNAINVLLDPGLAFGTGTHPTTALCLEWLERHELGQQRVVDFGCGSGILAISAAKLGAAKVYAIDIDPQALEATTDNAAKNQCSSQILPTHCTSDIKEPCDTLVANILLEPLMALKDTFLSLLSNNGTLVVSGLLVDQASTLIDHYKDQFKCTAQLNKEEWALVSFSPLQ